MITFRVKPMIARAALAVMMLALPATAREASFLPPVEAPPVATSPQGVDQNPAPPPAPAAPLPTAPLAIAPAATTAPLAAPPALGPAPVATPVELSKPVETATLKEVSPEAVGTLLSKEGGLGAGMWKDTPRALIERLLPALALPTSSAALNNLALRFLLTSADVPEADDAAKQTTHTLTAARVDRLIALGDAADAWKLATLAKVSQVDEITLRLAAEAAMLTSAAPDVCEKLPAIIQAHNSPEWQKLQVVCRLQAKDIDGAQLGLEVLRADNVQDPSFFGLAERTIIAGGKNIPRQLTPLKPLTVALLLIANQPLPPEIYGRVDAALIAPLLQTKAKDENARLALAERAAARGLITPAQLAETYRSVTFGLEVVSGAMNSFEAGARRRALLYQASLNDKATARLDMFVRFTEGMSADALTGAFGQLAAQMIAGVSAAPENSPYAVLATQVLILAGKTDQAAAWFTLARQAAEAAPNLAAPLHELWPLAVLANLESDGDYGKNLSQWLTVTLKDSDRAARERAGNILLVLDAAGFAVTEENWARVADVTAPEKRTLPPSPLLLSRLRAAGVSNRVGESALLSLAAPGNNPEPSLPVALESIRALRLADLKTDAAALARETMAAILMPPAPKK